MNELLVAWVAFPALQLLIWFGCGSLVLRRPSALSPPVGFCVVVVVGGFVTAVPALAEWTTPVIGALALAGIVLIRPWRLRISPWLAGALGVVFVAYAAPIVLSGSATFAGYIKLDDTATWLALTDRVMEAGRSLDGLAPSSYEATLDFNLADGYPIGVFIPLGVGQAVLGIDSAWLIQPYMALLAVLLALALWDLSGRVLRSERARAAVVAISAQPALLYGYYLWGGIKELAAAALIALVVCLSVAATTSKSPVSRVVPAAWAIAALLSVLSVAGVVWVGPALLVLGALTIISSSLRRAAVKGVTLVGLVAAMAVPLVISGALVPPTSLPLDDPDARGNLAEALSPLQALGIWPSGDFRFDPAEMSVTIVLCVFAAVAAAGAVAAAIRSRLWDLVAYVVAVPVAALAIALVGSPWVEAKAFAIVSPTLVFAALVGCAWAWIARRAVIAAGVGAFIVAGVVWSNLLAFSEVNLAPRDQLEELEMIAPVLDGEGPVLMTEYQPYGVRHFLRDSEPEGASELRRRLVPLADGTSLPKGEWADTDDFRAGALNPYRWLVLRRSPEQSRPPGNWGLAWSGDFYEVWEREEEANLVAERLPLGDGRSPVAVPRCAEVRALASAFRNGTIRAASSPEPIFAELATSALGSLSADAEVKGGAYELWVSGSIRSRAEISVDGERVSSAGPLLNNSGLYAELGQAELATGPHEITIELAGSGLRPGSGAPAEEDVSLALRPAPDVSAVEEFDPSEADRICGSRWDWVEASPE